MSALSTLLQPNAAAAYLLRRAVIDDVSAIVGLLADEALGRQRESAADGDDLAPYLVAFEVIDQDRAQLLVVATAAEEVVATLQLTFIPGLSRRGAWRAQIEAVRVASDHRRSGLGAAMMTWAVDQARERGCRVVQLTTDKSRVDAHRFYDRLGFVASHEGYKLTF